MPCADSMRPDDRTAFFRGALCAVFLVLAKDGTLETTLGRADLQEAGVKMNELPDWWADHLQEDLARRTRETEAARRKEMAERAEYERLKEKFG